MKSAGLAFILSLLAHAFLALGLVLYLQNDPHRSTLQTLDLTSVEINFESSPQTKFDSPEQPPTAEDLPRSEMPPIKNIPTVAPSSFLPLPQVPEPPQLTTPHPTIPDLPSLPDLPTVSNLSDLPHLSIHTPPRPLKAILLPRYPQAAREKGIEGRVVLEASISTNGTVTSVRIIESTHSEELDAAAEKALYSARFIPARAENGTPIPAQIRIPLVFKLK